MRRMVHNGYAPLVPAGGNERNEGKERDREEKKDERGRERRGEGRKECDREREEGRREICGSVNHGKDARRPGGCCFLDFCPRNEKPAEEHGQLSHPGSLEDR